VRYAVVGLGHIAQVAVLPAFKHAAKNSELVGLFSDDPKKQKELARKYRVPLVGSYKDYDTCLRNEEIDAVYIAEPNSLHCDFTVRAANAGVHVLCEKPLAVTAQECRRMIEACRRNRVKLMTAYRLHFERSNLEAIKVVQSGKIGEPRYFNSIFSMQAREGNIRLRKAMGGGTLYDIGIYCINATRYLFQEEPIEVLATTASKKDPRFRQVEEMAAATLRFPGERLATFICSFGAADAGSYDVVGTEGRLRMKNAYEYVMPITMEVTVKDKTQTREFGKRDQFAAELIYFSGCVLKNKDPEPSGVEGLNDVRIIQALYESAKRSRPIKLSGLKKTKRPSLRQEIRRRPVQKPEVVKASTPSKD
jgi:glucose-fructose oxidoreductase